MTYRDFFTLDGTSLTPQRFYWAWIAATAAYGVGDTVTTLAMVFFVPGLREANPLVAGGLDLFGPIGLAAVKVPVLVVCLLISQHAARSGDRWDPYILPGIFAVFGTVLTAYNLSLLIRVA